MSASNRSKWICAALSAVLAAAMLTPQVKAADLQAIEARLQQLEDREDIRALILAYGRALDGRDFHAFAGLFAEDAGEWVGGLGSAKGRDAIFELMDSTIGHNPQSSSQSNFHVFSNEQIVIDGDTAGAVTKWIFVVQDQTENSPQWLYLGHYNDTYIREEGDWRFLRREAFTDIPVQDTPAVD